MLFSEAEHFFHKNEIRPDYRSNRDYRKSDL